MLYMVQLRSSILAVSLIACLLSVGGVFSAQAVEHIPHHAQHHAGTHATTLCTWFCAAAQGVEADGVVVEGPVVSELRISEQEYSERSYLHGISPASRAPPVLA